jgi:glycosyltransferase involved in cell wall biosynthesis
METINSKHLTALILTFNEENNISRVLDRLQWLEKVIIVDSFSTDQTIRMVQSFSNTELHYRKFDTFGAQWHYGLSLIPGEWVLSLDADYVLTPEFIAETKQLIGNPGENVAFESRFKFAVFGKPLRKDNTTPRPVLFMREKGHFWDDGHTQRLKIDGRSGAYRSFIIHDDRKSLSRWIANLDSYSIKECRKLMDDGANHKFVIKVRRTKILAPFLVFFYCMFINLAFLDGWRGWHYTLQRTLVEMLFALRLIEEENLKPMLAADESEVNAKKVESSGKKRTHLEPETSSS